MGCISCVMGEVFLDPFFNVFTLRALAGGIMFLVGFTLLLLFLFLFTPEGCVPCSSKCTVCTFCSIIGLLAAGVAAYTAST